MKYQYVWINDLINQIPKINLTFKSREECDDEFVMYEGGHGHSHDHEKGGHGHSHDAPKSSTAEADRKLYDASMSKLKLVSFVSIFFMIA